jgi:uncharacterized peroxidase-related enzyme
MHCESSVLFHPIGRRISLFVEAITALETKEKTMSRIHIPTRDEAPAAAQPTLDAVNAQLGRVPNFFRVIANSPAVLAAHGAMGQALGKALDLKTRERIALTVAGVNGCEYCDAAHSYTGYNFAGLSPAEIALARVGGASEPKAAAAVAFAKRIAETRGKVDDADIDAVRAAGFDDARIVEIVAVVAENFFTNLVNNVARTDVDFPAIDAGQQAA